MELSDIFREFGAEYIQKFGDKIPQNHLKAIRDILACRTPQMGGQTYYCEECEEYHYSYHSCKNRHCPKCQHEAGQEWLENQMDLILPVNYFLVTFTIPGELRSIVRSHQKLMYSILFKSSTGSLKKLSLDPKFIGGEIGMVGILHTWTRDLFYHPHIHFIVPGGGYDKERNVWHKANHKFLLPVKALSKIFRAKFQDEMKKKNLLYSIPKVVWKKRFVTHSEPVGKGETVIKYLAPYIYRVAISNSRIIKMEDHKVIFKYKDSNSNEWKLKTLDAMEFIRRFLQHVLPKGFQKVRYYGFLGSASRETFEKIKHILWYKR